MEYKNTLNLPQTPFPIKFNFKEREPQLLELWNVEKIYELVQKEGKGKYILHDGPPYPNGDIHLGHALNKILKDIVVKFRSMEGYCVPFVPGWDCHGLPIETQLLKELSVRRSSLSVYEFRQKCRQYALKYVETQKEEFKRIGVFGRWDRPYLTLDPGYEAGVIELFGIMADKGYVFKSLKPIHWCPSCETALAEAEIEYEDDESPSIFVRFQVKDVKAKSPSPLQNLTDPTRSSFIIWTTTPWTLPSNVAIAVHPEFEYAFVENNGYTYVIAKELVESSAKSMGWTDYKITGSAKGSEFEGVVCSHPFMDRDSLVVMDEFVTLETGTGCVHIAPGHGDEDFKVGLKYKLPIVMPVDPRGCFTDEVPFLTGTHVWKANPIVLETLKEKGALLSSEKMKHQYPHCWRCKKPVIFRATEQWFISVDHNDLRSKALKEIEKTKWFPSWGQNRITSMVEGRPDWCISRQRSWGIPIPAFYCKKCGTPNFKGDFNKAVAAMVRKEGTDAWFVKEASDILPKCIKCEKCGGQEFEKETDIMDVWLESGSSHFSVLKSDEKTFDWPADLYLEGSDQHRGWFQTSLLTATAALGRAPFKAVLTHGFTVDEKGKKMSKSLGNVVDPQQVVKEYGADVLRLWVASTDFRNDMAVSKNILKQINEGFTKIRNTCRFLLSNINGFDAKKDFVEYAHLLDIDKYILMKFEMLLNKLRRSYDDFEFHSVYHSLYGFCVNDLSAFYLDVIKDRLYCDGIDSESRRAAQTACVEMLSGIIKAMAPIMTFTAEDIYSYLDMPGKKSSIFLEELPDENPKYMDEKIGRDWERVLEIRAEAYKKVEALRASKEISKISESDIEISCEKDDLDILTSLKDQLPQVFMVSSVAVKQGISLNVTARKTANAKCERCWRYMPDVGSDSAHPSLCRRCADVVKSM